MTRGCVRWITILLGMGMGCVVAWRMAIRRPKEYRYTAHPHPSKMDARLGESYQQVLSQRESVQQDQSVSQWEHAPRQRVAASTFERYSFGLLMAILQAATRPIPTPAK